MWSAWRTECRCSTIVRGAAWLHDALCTVLHGQTGRGEWRRGGAVMMGGGRERSVLAQLLPHPCSPPHLPPSASASTPHLRPATLPPSHSPAPHRPFHFRLTCHTSHHAAPTPCLYLWHTLALPPPLPPPPLSPACCSLHPSLPFLVWLMAAHAKGYALGCTVADELLRITYQIASKICQWEQGYTLWGQGIVRPAADASS